VTLVSPKMVYF